MKASIVIPAHNVQTTIADLLQTVLGQAHEISDVEIIVVDDGSSDRTAAIVADMPVQLLKENQRGAAAARNSGLYLAQGDIVIFIDADCMPERGWLAAMLDPFIDSDVIGVSGCIKTQQKGTLALFIQFEYDQRFRKLESYANIDFITSATGAYRRGVLQEVGGFNEGLWGAEDAELSFRLADLGNVMRYAPAALVYHIHPTSLPFYGWRKCRYAYSRMQVYRQFKDKIISDSRTPHAQKMQMVLLSMSAVSLLAAAVWSELLWASLALFVAYIVTITPTVRTMLQKNVRVGLMSPIYLTVSTLASLLGVAAALIDRIIPVKHFFGVYDG